MFGMVTIEDVWKVVNLGKDRGSDCFLVGPTRRLSDSYNARPGFFTPYKDKHEFFGGLVSNLVYPVTLGFFAGLSVILVALGTAIGVGCVLASVGAAICGSYEFCDESIENAGTAFHIAGLALLAIVVSTLLAALSLFHTPLTFFTRSGATLAGYTASSSEQQEGKKTEYAMI